MTEEEEQQIRERAEGAYHLHVMDTPLDTAYPDIAHDYHVDVTALLAEVERLRKALHDIAIEAEAGARHNDEMGDGFLLYVAAKFDAIRQIVGAVLEPAHK